MKLGEVTGSGPRAAILLAALAATWIPSQAGAGEDAPSAGRRGPGLKPPGAAAALLRGSRPFEFGHLQPGVLARELGGDARRMFDFVRDHVRYEAYAGCLRGSAGTLLALAGNSTDRAVLLADLLKAAGHEVRFARGTLPEGLARELIASMWVDRPSDAPAREVSPRAKSAADRWAAGVERDYARVRALLTEAKGLPRPEASDPAVILREARTHVWVQVRRDDRWVDWDPSTADSEPGHAHAPVEGTFDAVPEDWRHRVTIRLQVEEYALLATGEEQATPVVREVLRHEAAAADLSGSMIVLAHQPEEWKGPATSVETALAEAIADTGRVKPVLVFEGGEPGWKAGESFRQRMPAQKGLGGAADMLRGAGSRHPVPVAAAEWLDFDFAGPSGRTTVRREVYDLLGPARRRSNEPLRQREVIDATNAKTNFPVPEAMFALFFTTGRIDAAHAPLQPSAPPEAGVPPDIGSAMRRAHVAFALRSDAALRRVGTGAAQVRFWPASTRVQILDLVRREDTLRLSLDLRLDAVRAVSQGPSADAAHRALLLRGLATSALERDLLRRVGIDGQDDASRLRPVFSAASVFDQAADAGVGTRLVVRASDVPAGALSEDVRARVAGDLERGFVAVVPEAPVKVGDAARYGWWRIDPRTGESIGVTEEGLHGAEKPLTKSTLTIVWSSVMQRYYVSFVVESVTSSGIAIQRILRLSGEDLPTDLVDDLITWADRVLRINA